MKDEDKTARELSSEITVGLATISKANRCRMLEFDKELEDADCLDLEEFKKCMQIGLKMVELERQFRYGINI